MVKLGWRVGFWWGFWGRESGLRGILLNYDIKGLDFWSGFFYNLG